MEQIHQPVQALDEVRLNEAAPVIGDTAMETITETIITESSMIGHNPSTPAGAGEAVGELNFSGKPGKCQGKHNPISWLQLIRFPMRKCRQG